MMSSISEILRGPESQRLEFKELFGKETIETVAAFFSRTSLDITPLDTPLDTPLKTLLKGTKARIPEILSKQPKATQKFISIQMGKSVYTIKEHLNG